MVCALARKGQSSAHMNRGIAYAEQHKPAKAVADLGAAIDANKANAAAYYNRGNSRFASLGRPRLTIPKLLNSRRTWHLHF